jgi:hypothetical protein
MGPKNDPCLAPDDPRNLWQFFNKIEQNEKKKWRSECICCGQMYWDFTPSKILEHFGFQSTRHNAAKFKPCKGIDKDEHKDVKATVQRIHAAEFAAKSALKLALAQGSRTQQAAHDEFFHERGVNVEAARASGHLPVSQSPLLAAFNNAAARNPSTSAAESPVLAESPARPVVQPRKLSEAAKEKLDEVWSDAIYTLALPFNFLEHPSIREAINTTANLVRTLRLIRVPRRSSEFRCCRGGV